MKPNKPIDGAITATICGDAGAGKTTFGASFPNPVFIRAEDGLKSIPYEQRPDAFPVLQLPKKDVKSPTVLEQIREQLLWVHLNGNYQTVVIDSVTALDQLFAEEIIQNDEKARGLNTAMGGYGNGYSSLLSQHNQVMSFAKKLNEKGINVIFLAHTSVETIDLPDADGFDRFCLSISRSKKIDCGQAYINLADIVGLIRLTTFVVGDGKKMAVTDNSRTLVVASKPSSVTKNRFGITADMLLTGKENPLLKHIPSLRKPTPPVAIEPQPEPETQPETETANKGEQP